MAQARRLVGIFGLVIGLLLVTSACSDDDGGGSDAVGTFVHAEEGTIELSDGGSGTWTQEGNDEPWEFNWSEEDGTVTITDDGGDSFDARLEDGDLVIPDEAISGDEDVTFERK